jgi:hypothetical protein
MKFSYIIWLILLISASAVFAEDGKQVCNYLLNDAGAHVGAQIPGKFAYKNEVINGYTMDDSVIGHAIVQNGIVTELDCTEMSNATLKVYVLGNQTINTIIYSNSTIDAIDNAISNGELKIVGVGAMKKVGVFFTRAVIKVMSWFA